MRHPASVLISRIEAGSLSGARATSTESPNRSVTAAAAPEIEGAATPCSRTAASHARSWAAAADPS